MSTLQGMSEEELMSHALLHSDDVKVLDLIADELKRRAQNEVLN